MALSDKNQKGRRTSGKTGERQTTAERAAAAGIKTAERTAADGMVSKDKDALKERVRNMKKTLDAPKYIGSEEELIPFSWRYPLVMLGGGKKMTKVYKNIVSLERSLTLTDGER